MANIQRYGGLLDDFFGDFDKGFWVKPYAMPGEPALKMKVDVKETDKAYTVHADIPGVVKDDIQVDVNGDQVSIRAEVKREKEKKDGEKLLHSERYYGMVSRSFTLPTDVDAQGAIANYKDGVLELTLPKKAGAQTRRLAIH
ncbi:MAG: heat-shock protein Hsp20 [Betaproteobacteria bacterium RIFCSPLOWO2_02_67_12]|nr:MAG: heat-shock protein Hsp20 [Betaproteobacteria bacterium RIFCSPLOWO2_02_67_12]OGA29278.1 MAG: heat-shock protein Hsp20 [Betaproteobacteria bacterium RIFCSPLOWO2_02_FULL_68_150]OGA60178.1 MAG: heat-shock protein Hsp20 [Betaproteobacteria bacterium RIFCSPLOWO2_12_FULL_67_28]